MRLVILTIMGSALLLAGCSNNDSESARLSKAEYLKKANAICKAAQERVDEVTEPLDSIEDPMDDPEKVADLLEDSIEIFETAQSEVEVLRPPASDQAEVDEINRASRKADRNARAVIAKIRDRDPDALENDPFEDYNRKANDFGLDECGT